MSEAGNESAAPANWRECAFVTVQRCAEVLGLSTASVYGLEKDGRLEFRRVAGRTLVTVASVAAVADTAEAWAPASRGAAARRAMKGAGS